VEKKKNVLAFLDVETTGLSPFHDDRICEIGIVRTSGSRILARLDTLVNPERPVSYGALGVHGITDEMLSGAPKFADISGEVMEILKDSVVICHNAQFDLSFLSSELKRCDIEMPDFRTGDTLRIARRYFDFPSNSLGNIVDYIGIEMDKRHRALSDAEATFKVFLYMRAELQRRGLTDINRLFTPIPSLNLNMLKKKTLVLPAVLEEALRKQVRILMRYISNSGTETERVVKPLQVINRQDYLYLIAYCDLRGGERTFRLDRIVEMKIL
jgi:DNA polymerase III subunit epsilon